MTFGDEKRLSFLPARLCKYFAMGTCTKAHWGGEVLRCPIPILCDSSCIFALSACFFFCLMVFVSKSRRCSDVFMGGFALNHRVQGENCTFAHGAHELEEVSVSRGMDFSWAD